MSSIGSRLREERERLGHSQSDLAELGGTQRKSQFNYETDARRPDADYLAAIAEGGVNVLYVLTGSSEGVPPLPLTPEEQQLLDHFRSAPEAVRRAALGALLSASPADSSASRRQPAASKNQSAAPRGKKKNG